METVLERVRALTADIQRNARDPDRPPMLLPVTKTRTPEEIRPLMNAGIRDIGENRVQELMAKYPALSPDFSFHLIGRLQTNKIKYIMGRVSMVQSLDRMLLAQALDARAQAAGLRLPVLVEVNIGGEGQKAGIAPEEAVSFARACARLPGLRVSGLMTVMPLVDDPETLRPLFRRMRALFESVRAEGIAETDIRALSMGMSGDYRVAAQEGATILRIGSAIFGARARPEG